MLYEWLRDFLMLGNNLKSIQLRNICIGINDKNIDNKISMPICIVNGFLINAEMQNLPSECCFLVSYSCLLLVFP